MQTVEDCYNGRW